MATVTSNRKSRKSDLTVSLALAIDHVCYSITPIHPQDPDVSRAWRLEKRGGDGAVYDVATTIHGHQCTCPDWETRRNGIDPAGCKHVRACVAMGLLEDSAPAREVEPTPLPSRPMPANRCSKCSHIGMLMKDGVCIDCRRERCDICEQTGTRRLTRADGLTVCPECSKRQADEAERKSLLAEPACCQPDEPTACQSCQTTTPAVDVATSLLSRALELAAADPTFEGLNLPVELPDAYDDEPFEQPVSEAYDPGPEDDDSYAAMLVERHLDASAVLGLAEAVDHVTDAFRAWQSPFGNMLAEAMEALALRVRLTESTTPQEFAERADTLDAEARSEWERIGEERGRQAAAKPLTDIDDPAARRGRPQPQNAFGAQPFHRHLV